MNDDLSTTKTYVFYLVAFKSDPVLYKTKGRWFSPDLLEGERFHTSSGAASYINGQNKGWAGKLAVFQVDIKLKEVR